MTHASAATGSTPEGRIRFGSAQATSANTQPVGVPGHLERFLGPIAESWHRPELAGVSNGLKVARFSNEIGVEAPGIPYCSMGLSNRALQLKGSGALVRQELLMLTPSWFTKDGIVDVLFRVGTEMAEHNLALERGEVRNCEVESLIKLGLTGLYATVPAYLPEEFFNTDTPFGLTWIVWLVPVFHSETHFIIENGWKSFEGLLADVNPELSDFYRKPIG